MNELVQFIVDHKIKAIFVESSVPHKTIEAVQEAAKAKGWNVAIGGELYSDSLGSEGTEGGTYIGMVKANIDTIAKHLNNNDLINLIKYDKVNLQVWLQFGLRT